MLAALSIANEIQTANTFCVMFPDIGERYLSSLLFEGIATDSDEDWLVALRELCVP
tara:strand:+ start:124 stop:291 length:168 start_codon:yes stop_codon:yes gene_type:complete